MKQMLEVHAETDRFVSGPRCVEFPESSCLDRAGYGYAGSGGFSVLLGRKGENGILAGIRCRDRECYIIIIGILRHRGVQRGCEISLCMVGPGEQDLLELVPSKSKQIVPFINITMLSLIEITIEIVFGLDNFS